jgi:hypothetical protein
MLTEKAKENKDAATHDLWRIAETDDTDQVESILASGADINASNAHGMTALMRAAASGRIRMVRVLLKHGADPNTLRNDKFTPLMLAAFFGHQEIVQILVEHGANTDATTRSGTSAQMWTARGTFEDVVHYLENPSTTGRTSKVETVTDTSLRAGNTSETSSAKGDGDLNSKTPTIVPESSLNEGGSLAELGSATFASAVQRSNDLPEVHDTLQYSAPTSWFLSRLQPLNRRFRVYALTTLLLFVAVSAHLTLERKRRLTELTFQTHSTATVSGSAVVVMPRAADTLPDASETKVIAPSDTEAASRNNVTTDYKRLNQSKGPLETSGIVSRGDSGRSNFSEKQNRITSVSHPPPIAVRTPEEERTTELPVPAASTAKPQPAVPRDAISMKRPVPLTTQLISGSKSSPANGKVIQWP